MSFEVLLLVLASVTAVSGLARRFGVPPPFLLVVGGLAVSYVPGVPEVSLDPHLVLVLVLPPLLYAAALSTAYADFGDNLRPIGLLSVGLVLVTTFAVAGIATLVVPALPIAAAIALGAIVAPPDAIAATAVARRMALPRRVLVILEGESLLNDATALVSYRIAVSAAVVGGATVGGALGDFAVAAIGGSAIGLLLGVVLAALRRRLHDPLLENAVSLLTPFAAFLPAEKAHASGVLAVVVTGLYLGRRAPVLLSSGARLQGQALWAMVTFFLEGLVFALIGLQLPQVVDALGDDAAVAIETAAAVTATVVLVRFAWVFPATYLPRWLSRRLRSRDPAPPWRYPFLIGWAGMRGVVSLAAAFALPTDMPGRDLILFVTFCVIIATLLVQGMTLPWLVRRLDLDDDGEAERIEKAVATADHHVARMALQELERMDADMPPSVSDELRHHLEERVRHAHAVLGGCPGEDEYDDGATPEDRHALADAVTTVQVRRQLLDVERSELLRLYRARDIDDEVLRALQQQLDVEELGLAG
ncbi:MAG TPA: Na+/H+ antiporter [Mycobacteriales bacterium]|jgi:CPA1 family monovalent cation:H+ antiporter|nr:Na+/H+ antiporter [Mycobacteriales bacterium]